jgi:hypothetical protein
LARPTKHKLGHRFGRPTIDTTIIEAVRRFGLRLSQADLAQGARGEEIVAYEILERNEQRAEFGRGTVTAGVLARSCP